VIDAAASLATFAASGTVLAFVLSGRLPFEAYLIAHAGSAAFAGLMALRSGTPPRRQALLLAMMSTALGPVGSAGTFLCCIFEFCFRPFASPFTEWFASIFPEDELSSNAVFIEQLASSDDPVDSAQRVASFRDFLVTGSIEQKQAIIALIARRFTPSFAPALRQALQDPIPAVRVQAAAAAAAIEGRYADRTFELTQRANRPDASIEEHRTLAAHLAEFSESGIAEEQRSRDAAGSALSHLGVILNSHPNDAQALSSSARLLLRQGDAAAANERISRAMSTSGVSAELAALHFESLVQLGRFAEVRQAALRLTGRFADAGRDGQRLESMMSLWVKGAVNG
jgi:hypothetical protein